MSAPGPVILLSSHVAIGAVGNRVAGFALERLGIETVQVPTVILAHHPGQGPVEPIRPAPEAFATLLDGIAKRLEARPPAAILTGYFAGAEEAEAASRFVERLKRRYPELLYLCDPVFGDAGRAYLPEGVVALLRERLLPMADIATPNLFECCELTGLPHEARLADLTAAASGLGPPEIIVTSAPALMRGRIAAALVTAGGTLLAEHPAVASPAKGAGDLFAALYLGRRLLGTACEEALALAAAATHDVFAATAALGRADLAFAQAQEALVRPGLQRVALRRLACADRAASAKP
ncbi:pyridoxal kinase [Afifella pfennigii]|uniref:pyridoxal kinase n=1 Tax=Afifella pfennigii TaxID=209897 RepID=UPI00047E5388|nr:pyridoxal kinase [Afifella pfennigii]